MNGLWVGDTRLVYNRPYFYQNCNLGRPDNNIFQHSIIRVVKFVEGEIVDNCAMLVQRKFQDFLHFLLGFDVEVRV